MIVQLKPPLLIQPWIQGFYYFCYHCVSSSIKRHLLCCPSRSRSVKVVFSQGQCHLPVVLLIKAFQTFTVLLSVIIPHNPEIIHHLFSNIVNFSYII